MRGDDGAVGTPERLDARFTPTCVGTTSARRVPGPWSPVHPHVRGDDGCASASQPSRFGSPPRAWGRRPGHSLGGASRRFTPTCVGTTRGDRGDHRSVPVHPHVRGDDRSARSGPNSNRGSPPRAWGRPGGQWRLARTDRFTPTCVGTTTRTSRSSSEPIGSPPRAWGRRLQPSLTNPVFGFTPTCVGTTSPAAWHPGSSTVHPHVRGDDMTRDSNTARLTGSPPRAWGRLGQPDRLPPVPRFTPTCVGTTGDYPLPVVPYAVHPHVRGDDDDRAPEDEHEGGSPPRAWGRPLPVEVA